MSLTAHPALARMWEKNREEIRAILGGGMPRFARGLGAKELDREVPVFHFHSVRPDRFEEQLAYLKNNGYVAVTADELADLRENPPRPGHRSVALSFDDATGSFWATAFPLLAKYDQRAILYVVAGLVPEDDCRHPNLEDHWEGRVGIAEIEQRESRHPLCTWRELAEMQASGRIDVQSHSLTHSRVPISGRVVDFLHPHFEPCLFGNVTIPISRDDSPESPARVPGLGAPVYEFASRLEARPRFLEDGEVRRRMIEHVRHLGGERFFLRRGWRGELRELHGALKRESTARTSYEEPAETQRWIRVEFERSRELLERRVPGAEVRHFCYPWYRGSATSDTIAARCGYRSVAYGMTPGAGERDAPVRIRRLPEEYLLCLPGIGRRRPPGVWWNKIRHAMGKSG